MRRAAILFIVLFGFISYSNANCKGYRNYFSASINGNVYNQSLAMQSFSNATGFEISYGKAVGWGYAHGFKLSNRKYQFANNGLISISETVFGYELSQKIIQNGMLNIKLLGDAGAGFRKHTAINADDFAQFKYAFLDANVGAELAIKPICFLEVFGRSTLGYQYSKSAAGANYRSLNSVGLRYFL